MNRRETVRFLYGSEPPLGADRLEPVSAMAGALTPLSGRVSLTRPLNAFWFLAMADACQRIAEWRFDYNEERPQSALGTLAPSAFAAQLEAARRVARSPEQARG